jgi:hypothetical protein
MKERIKQINKEEVVRQKSRSPPKEAPAKEAPALKIKTKKSDSTEVQVGSAQPLSDNLETAAEIMKQMNNSACGPVIKQLTTHDKIKMVHGVMEHQKLKSLQDEVNLINKFFAK